MPDHSERGLQDVLGADTRPAFNTAAVARRTGVPPATFRAWERRYGFPSPSRGSGNQRSYSERDVRALTWLSDRLDEGMTISAAVALLRDRLAERPGPSARQPRPPAALAGDLEGALIAFDAGRAD